MANILQELSLTNFSLPLKGNLPDYRGPLNTVHYGKNSWSFPKESKTNHKIPTAIDKHELNTFIRNSKLATPFETLELNNP